MGKRDNVKIFGNDYNTPDGTAIRDYIHITDLANLHIKVLEFMIKDKKTAIFNFGYGNLRNTTIINFKRILQAENTASL